MLRKADDATPGPPGSEPGQPAAARPGKRMASAGLLVAVGTGVGNVLAYGFNLVLSRGLGPKGYAELGTLLAVFLIGSVPGMAVQAVNARRLAVAVDGPPEELTELCHKLRIRGLLAGLAVALLFLALSPAISALLPAVTTAGIAWTGVSLAANTVFTSYVGIAQGTSRFATMTVLYLSAHTIRLAIGVVAAHAAASPTVVMAAQTVAWALAALAGHFLLRGLTDRRAADAQAAEAALAEATATATATSTIPGPRAEITDEPPKATHGYTPELLRACGGLGGILLLTVLDTLLAGRYLADGDLGRYNTGALLNRAAFFGPAFIAILAFPRLARAAERRRALVIALILTAAIVTVAVAVVALGGDTLIKAAFGAKYADAAGSFDLGTYGWVFTALGALLALVNVALMDGVARRSHAVSIVILGGIVVETVAIVGFAHHSAGQIVTAAACSALAMAVVSVTLCLTIRTVPAAHRASSKADAIGALPRTSS